MHLQNNNKTLDNKTLNNNTLNNKTLAVILAGGASSRMKGDNKAFLKLYQNKSIIEHVIHKTEMLKPASLIISANHDLEKFEKFNYPVIPDSDNDYLGPLAGILSAMDWAKKYNSKIQYILSIACDTPFFPSNLLEKFLDTIKNNDDIEICLAACSSRTHAVFSLHKILLREKLSHNLIKQKKRKIMLWAQSCQYQIVRFEQNIYQNHSPFFNINTKEQLEKAKIIAGKLA